MKNLSPVVENCMRWGVALLLCCIWSVGFAAVPDGDEAVNAEKRKMIRIKGKVIGTDSEPIIGATVLEKGTTNGVATDVTGLFELNVKERAVLCISCLGYKTKEVVLGHQKALTVLLEEDQEELDEVVVVGYGTVKRKNFTGSVSTIRMDNSPLSLLPNTNPMSNLRGMVTGLTVG